MCQMNLMDFSNRVGRNFSAPIFRTPVIGDFLYFVFYFIAWFIISPLAAILSGCQKLKYGSSVFWMPKQKVQIVTEGVELLRNRDPEMFSRLTSKQRLIIFYAPPQAPLDRKSNHRVFLMHDKFIQFGPEGVACFIVQSLTIAAAVHRVNQHKLDAQERVALKAVSRNMVDWLTKHSFHQNLIDAYQKVVERQKQAQLSPVV